MIEMPEGIRRQADVLDGRWPKPHTLEGLRDALVSAPVDERDVLLPHYVYCSLTEQKRAGTPWPNTLRLSQADLMTLKRLTLETASYGPSDPDVEHGTLYGCRVVIDKSATIPVIEAT